MSGQWSKEIHVHIDGKENKMIINHTKIKTCNRLKLKEALQDFLVTLKQRIVKAIRPQLIPHTFFG